MNKNFTRFIIICTAFLFSSQHAIGQSPTILFSTGSATHYFPQTTGTYHIIDALPSIDLSKTGVYKIEFEILATGYWPGQTGFIYGIGAFPLINQTHELGQLDKEWGYRSRNGNTLVNSVKYENGGYIANAIGDRIRLEYNTTLKSMKIFVKRTTDANYLELPVGSSLENIMPGEGQELRFAVAGICYQPNGIKIISASIPNSAPTSLALSSTSIDENVAAGTVVGTIHTTDPDVGNTFTYALVSGDGDTDNALFSMSDSTISINHQPDYESKSSYTIRIKTEDQDGESYEKAFTISVNDLEEAAIINSSIYNAQTGLLSVSGANFKANELGMDVDVAKLTVTGEGGMSYALTSSGVEISTDSFFSVTLNATDLSAINQILNKNGSSSTGGTIYNLAANANWMSKLSGGEDLVGNGITVSNVAIPKITSSSYNVFSGSLQVSGSGLLKLAGVNNDIIANKLTFTGEGGASYTLNNTNNVDISSDSSFTLNLSTADKAVLNLIFNKNGTSSIDTTTYNLSAAEDWNTGAEETLTIAALLNPVTVSNVSPIIINVSSVKDNGIYGTGEVIPITITFSEVVTVTGTPQLTMETGNIDRIANYVSGSGSAILIFNYTVQNGDVNADLDYQSTSALDLHGGSIKDGAGNDASLTLAAVGSAGSLGANKDLMVTSTLPVALISFKAKLSSSGAVVLDWVTASEINNDHFLLEKSIDGKKFVSIHLTQSKNNGSQQQTYQHTDVSPENGVNYYRLSQFDKDGKSAIIGIATVNFQLSTAPLSLYPNPASEELHVNLNGLNYSEVQVINLKGEIIHNYPIRSNQLRIDIKEFPKGWYIIHFRGKSGAISRKVMLR